jgi:hypothetical protein
MHSFATLASCLDLSFPAVSGSLLAMRVRPVKKPVFDLGIVDRLRAGFEYVAGSMPIDHTPRIRQGREVVEYVWRAIDSGSFYPAPSPMSCPSCPCRALGRGWSGRLAAAAPARAAAITKARRGRGGPF